MNIKSNISPNKGPVEWFTGEVQILPIKSATDDSPFSVSSVTFTLGARAAWHTHPKGQTLYVTDGIGFVQKRGEPIQVIHPGDVIWTEPGEEHWHGATKDSSMTHLAMQDSDENGNFADWHEHVTDEEYNQQPEVR
jgi:quercetin dioxygenase-like cupin family protein